MKRIKLLLLSALSLFAVSSIVFAQEETLTVTRDGKVGIGITNPQSKLHIKNEGENALQLPLRLVNPDGTDGGGTATGILFETETAGFGKGALVYERTSDYGNGSFHFLQNALNNSSNPTLQDAVVTIKNNGNVEVDGAIHSKKGGFKFPDGSVQISAAGSGGQADNLGNHTATQNLKMNGHWLSGDGGNEGVFVKNTGNVGIGINNPTSKFQVAGQIHSTTGGIKFPDGTIQTTAGTGAGDNLGNHTATQNINLNGHSLLNGGILNEQDLNINSGNNTAVEIGGDWAVDVGRKTVIDGGDQITIQCGQASIVMKKNGDISIKGKKINIKASGDVSIEGVVVSITGQKIGFD